MVTLSTRTRRYLLVTGIIFLAYGVGMFAIDANAFRGSTTTIYIREISPEQPQVSEPAADQTVIDARQAEDSDSPLSTEEGATTDDSAEDSSSPATPAEPTAPAPVSAPAEPEPIATPSPPPPPQPSAVSSTQTVVVQQQRFSTGSYSNPPPMMRVPPPPARQYRYYVPRYPVARAPRGRRR